jgi:hypothetical protein
MENNVLIRCRVAACREAMNDGNEWSFYLINDSEIVFDAVLEEISYEWGDIGNSEKLDVCVRNLSPNAHALIWRDDGSGAELRMDLLLLVQLSDRQERLRFEFPKLYRKNNLPWVKGLGKSGWQEFAKGT